MMWKMMNPKAKKRGLFIAFEGGEGSGKTTLIRSVLQTLENHNYPCISVREPGGTALGEGIRALLLDGSLNINICAKAELCLFLAARAQNIRDNIEPALQQGTIVLCDRFNASTIAYQGYARGLGPEAVASFCQWVSEPTLPDVTLYLDVDPAIGLMRSTKLHKEHAAAGCGDRIESEALDFHAAVRQGFKAMADKDSFVMVDAALPVEVVFDQAWKEISRRLGM
jgi:dTMP kinase